jgi:hypothetical protein
MEAATGIRSIPEAASIFPSVLLGDRRRSTLRDADGYNHRPDKEAQQAQRRGRCVSGTIYSRSFIVVRKWTGLDLAFRPVIID